MLPKQHFKQTVWFVGTTFKTKRLREWLQFSVCLFTSAKCTTKTETYI